MASISEHNESENMKQSSMWWLKSTVRTVKAQNPQINITNEPVITSPNKQLEIDISSSIDEFLEKDQVYVSSAADDASEADIGSLIEEINKLASQSPIGAFETPATDKSVEEIMLEAEKLYLESSKSFEQLSSKSRSSLDYSLSKSSSLSYRSKKSTPSPKSSHSVLKLTQDFEKLDVITDNDRDRQTPDRDEVDSVELNNNENMESDKLDEFSHDVNDNDQIEEELDFEKDDSEKEILDNQDILDNEDILEGHQDEQRIQEEEEVELEELPVEKELILDKHEDVEPEVMEMQESPDPDIPEEEIEELHHEIEALKIQLKETKKILEENEVSLNKQSYSIQQKLDATIEELKDTKEHNTALQVQLKNLTKTHQELKANYEDLLASKRNLETRIAEIDINFSRCKSELISVKENNEKLSESETNLKKLLEIEKLQSKTARLQNEKDTKCIQDLNRQVKEMERIIQRKHPDSVSALIVAAKNDDSNVTARSLLENRIKQLESEASIRELQSNNVFSEIQEKFNLMKAKYESHIEDLEIHVNDLKNQIRSKTDTYDIYTQTYTEETPKLTDNKIKEVYNVGIQTDQIKTPKTTAKKSDKISDGKEDAHLLATIRGLQADLANKEKLVNKLQKELEDLRKTNRKLQKDRETNLKIAADRKDTHKVVEKHIIKSPDPIPLTADGIEKEIRAARDERDKIKAQLCRLEDDYQTLKTKRLQDLNILQEAHEREITTYMSNIGPMREQLDVQQISINNLQTQLASAKEELAIISVERDHLDSRLKNITMMEAERGPEDSSTQLSLQKKIAFLERRYEEREHRLRAIVHGLAQKQVSARDCAQCAARQQQLIGYKTELDQLLATLRYLQ